VKLVSISLASLGRSAEIARASTRDRSRAAARLSFRRTLTSGYIRDPKMDNTLIKTFQ